MQPASPPAAAPVRRPLIKKRKYRPLDAKTWFEGSLRLIGWILIICLSVATGGLWMMYELKVLNRHDTDFRDFYFDQRITTDVNNRYHKNFLLAQNCCNRDPVYVPSSVSCFEYFPDSYDPGPPYCKPIIYIECQDTRSTSCNVTRNVLYSLVGLTRTGVYDNCLLAGRVRVGVQQVSSQQIALVGYYRGVSTNDTLDIGNAFDIDVAQVRAFVETVASRAPPDEVNYVQPSVSLSASVLLEGQSASMSMVLQHDESRRARAPPPWNKVNNLWPWPGMNKRCDNTNKNSAYQIAGGVLVVLPRFSMAAPDLGALTLEVAGDRRLVGAWNVSLAASQLDDEVGGEQLVTVAALSSLTVMTGMVPSLGTCRGWRFSADPKDFDPRYSPVWTGPLSELQAGKTFGPYQQYVGITVRDTAYPRLIELFFYGGMWYIWLAFLMAFIWLVSNSLMLFVIILVWWNVRSNKGLPPLVYRYMRKYRGW